MQASTALVLRYSKVVSLLHLHHIPCHAPNGIMHSLRKSVWLLFLDVSVLISISPERARLSSWPGMSNEIKESVANCQICADFQAHNPRQPLQTHEIPDRPWSRVVADLFSLHGKNYIVLVDYYSNFLEVSELLDTSACSVIQFWKEQFSHHGIPDCLATDNGSQTVSHKFIQFVTGSSSLLLPLPTTPNLMAKGNQRSK